MFETIKLYVRRDEWSDVASYIKSFAADVSNSREKFLIFWNGQTTPLSIYRKKAISAAVDIKSSAIFHY